MDFSNVRQVTNELQEVIRAGTLDAPTWDLIRNAKLAAKIYAPLGTLMPLGEYIRLARRFSDVFKNAEKGERSSLSEEDRESILQLSADLKVTA